MVRSTGLSDVLRALDSFIERDGHACVPRLHIEKGLRLGDAVDHLRQLHADGSLPSKAIAALERRAGWYWERGEHLSHILITSVGEFIAVHGHAKFEAGTDLARAAEAMRTDLAEGCLRPHLFKALQSFPEWKWENSYDYGWGDRYRELVAFSEAYGHIRIPDNGSTSRLAQWLCHQRARFRVGNLPESRRRRLEMIPGWAWQTVNGMRQRHVAELKKYIALHGSADVPNQYVTPDGYRLGPALVEARWNYHRGLLSAGRIAALESVPEWTWEPTKRDESLNDSTLQALRAFVAREGHGNVPAAHEEAGYRLGTYLTGVRHKLRRGRLSEGRIAELDAAAPGWRRGALSPQEATALAQETSHALAA